MPIMCFFCAHGNSHAHAHAYSHGHARDYVHGHVYYWQTCTQDQSIFIPRNNPLGFSNQRRLRAIVHIMSLHKNKRPSTGTIQTSENAGQTGHRQLKDQMVAARTRRDPRRTPGDPGCARGDTDQGEDKCCTSERCHQTTAKLSPPHPNLEY